MYQVPLTRVSNITLRDFPARLNKYADWIDKNVRYGTDVAEQLRGDAAMLETLALSIQARMNIGG